MNSTDKNNIIDGRKFSKEYTDNVLRPRCDIFKEKYHSIPKLSTIIVGDDPASESYRRIREKFFANLCVDYVVSSLPEETTQEEGSEDQKEVIRKELLLLHP